MYIGKTQGLAFDNLGSLSAKKKQKFQAFKYGVEKYL